MSKHIVLDTKNDRTRNVYKLVPTINACKIRSYDVVTGEKLGTATVSVADIAECKNYLWRPNKLGYFVGSKDGEQIFLHRFVMGEPVGAEVDHINGNPRNNQRTNLRTVTHAEQMRNRKKSNTGHPINDLVPVNGVYWDKTSWKVEIYKNNRKINGGNYANLLDAVLERIKLEEIYFGALARNKQDVVDWIKQHDRDKVIARQPDQPL